MEISYLMLTVVQNNVFSRVPMFPTTNIIILSLIPNKKNVFSNVMVITITTITTENSIV